MKTDRKIKRSRQFKKFAAAFLIAGLSVFSQLPAAHALPGGGNVVTMPGLGTADISNNALKDMLVAITGNGAIINWDSFSIDSGESVRFNFDLNNINPNAAVLNRVTGPDISLINGLLAANGGKVLLVNQNGIVFGQGANLNAPLFIASTIDIDDPNFQSFIEGGTTTLLFDKPGLGGAIQVVGDTYTGIGKAVSFIAPTVSIAPGVTLSSADKFNDPRNLYSGAIWLNAENSVAVNIYGGNVLHSSLTGRNPGNIINIGGAAAGSAVGAAGIALRGGTINIDGSLDKPSVINNSTNFFNISGSNAGAVNINNARLGWSETQYYEPNPDIRVPALRITAGQINITGSALNAAGSPANQRGKGNVVIVAGRIANDDFYAANNTAGSIQYTSDAASNITLTGSAIRGQAVFMNGGNLILTGDTIETTNGRVELIAANTLDADFNDVLFFYRKNITADATNGIVIDGAQITTTDNTGMAGGRTLNIQAGKIELTDSVLRSHTSIRLIAAEKHNYLQRDDAPADSPYGSTKQEITAGAANEISIKNSRLSLDGNDKNNITAIGGSVNIGTGSNITVPDGDANGGGIRIAAAAQLSQDSQSASSQYETSLTGGETDISSAAGNTVILEEGAALNTTVISLFGNSIKIDGDVTARETSHLTSSPYVELTAADKLLYSDANGQEVYEFSSGNKVETGATGTVGSAQSLLILADTVDNKGTGNVTGASTTVVGATEATGVTGGMSGKDHTTDGEIVNVNGFGPVTIKTGRDKAKLALSWEEDSEGNDIGGSAILYLKAPATPTDPTDPDPTDPTDPVIPPVDENTGNSEVIQAAEDAIKNAASDGEALKVIEGVFNNIKDKSDADKTEIIVGVIYAAAQEGLDQKDVTQAIVNGSKGEGAFNANLSDAGNETARQSEPKAELRPDSSAGQATAAGQGNNVQPDITPGQGAYQEQPVTIEGQNAL